MFQQSQHHGGKSQPWDVLISLLEWVESQTLQRVSHPDSYRLNEIHNGEGIVLCEGQREKCREKSLKCEGKKQQ